MLLLALLLLLVQFAVACLDHSTAEFTYSFAGEPESTKSELSTMEKIFAAQPNRNLARINLKYLTSKPHQAGTRQDKVLAEFMVSQFERFGFHSAWTDPIPATLSYPHAMPLVAILHKDGSVSHKLKLTEDLLDSTSDVWDRNHTSLGYSPSGEAKANVVYANFGTPQDFEVLRNNGVEVKGKIVLVRYGRCFRGLKVKNAQDRGAIAVLIYSDPMEDGFVVGAEYPQGPWRPRSSVQRGSVQYNSICTGDPDRRASFSINATFEKCGYAAKDLIPAIPALPLAWEDALPLLRLLQNGPHPPKDFIGGLPNLTYQLGPTKETVWMRVTNRQETKLVWNAFGMIKGQHFGTKRDRPVILGNHRDAWVFGAVDPNSGTSAMLEVARGYSVLLKLGWIPKRTMLFASWSGEELGMLGSTAFGEAQARGFLKTSIAYVNVDIGVSGKIFQLATTATLARLVRQVVQALPDPELANTSLLARWPNNQQYAQLGTGSDYTVFIHHLGIPSIDMRFSPARGNGGAATQYGVYHSDFDSFDWMDKQGDPGFVFHETMAKVFGIVALRLADSRVLPFSHIDQAKLIETFVDRVKPMLVPFCPLAFAEMKFAANAYLLAAVRESASSTLDVSKQNDRRAFSERKFLAEQGLPLRKWYKHVLHAPSLHLGYDADFLPGIVQAFRDMNNTTLAVEQARLFTHQLNLVTRYLTFGV